MLYSQIRISLVALLSDPHTFMSLTFISNVVNVMNTNQYYRISSSGIRLFTVQCRMPYGHSIFICLPIDLFNSGNFWCNLVHETLLLCKRTPTFKLYSFLWWYNSWCKKIISLQLSTAELYMFNYWTQLKSNL
jgi:hypothetical protein